jgi:hypothetical protein
MSFTFLPGNKISFDLSVKGESTGSTYAGHFVMRLFLSLKQRNQLAAEYSKRDNGNEKDEVTSAITRSTCELQAHCEECPAWFKGEAVWELVDIQPLVSLRETLEEALKAHLENLEA